MSWWDSIEQFLRAPVPVWFLLVIAAILAQKGSSDDRISEIAESVEELRRKICPTEAERRHDYFEAPK